MDAEPVRQDVLEIAIGHVTSCRAEDLSRASIVLEDLVDGVHFHSLVPYVLGRLRSLLSRVNEDEHLVAVLADVLEDFGVSDIVHRLELLDGFTLSDANELLTKRTWTERRIEVKETLVHVNAEEARDILIVGQRG